MEETAKRLELILDQLVDVRNRIFSAMHQQMIDLVLCVARAILEQEIKAEPEYLVRLVREAVSMVADGDEVEVSVAPSDYQLLDHRIQELGRENPRARTLLVKANEKIDVGCIVETRLARVDATLGTRLLNIAEALHAVEDC